MVPQQIKIIPYVPLTVSGKVDFSKLSEIAVETTAPLYVKPEGFTEEFLSKEVGTLLGLSAVSATESILHHSLFLALLHLVVNFASRAAVGP